MNKTPDYLRVSANVANEHFNIQSVYAIALEQNVDDSMPIAEHFVKTQLQSNTNHALEQLYNPYTLDTSTTSVPSDIQMIGYISKVYSNIHDNYSINDVVSDVNYHTYLLINDSSPTLPYLIPTREVDTVLNMIELQNHEIVYDSESVLCVYKPLVNNVTVSYIILTNDNASLHDIQKLVQDYPEQVTTTTHTDTDVHQLSITNVLDSFFNVVQLLEQQQVHVYILGNRNNNEFYVNRISLTVL